MKGILLFLVLQVFNGYSQSKKEQIADLNFRIDSLKTELDRAKITNKEKDSTIELLSISINNLEATTQSLEKELTNCSNNSKLLSEQFESLKKTLNGTKKQLDSLNNSNAQSKNLKQEKSAIFAGSYKTYSDNSDAYGGGYEGTLNFFTDKNGLYYFFVSYVSGPPSFNLGELFGTIKIYGNIGVFQSDIYNDNYSEDGCKIIFVFDEYSVTVIQPTDSESCGFGNAVNVGGFYFKESSDNVLFERWLDPEYGTLNVEDAVQSTNKW